MSGAEHPFPWSEDAVCRPSAESDAGCSCDYPYLGAQRAGTPLRCERCRLLVLEDGKERIRVANEKALRDLYERAEARGDTRHIPPVVTEDPS